MTGVTPPDGRAIALDLPAVRAVLFDMDGLLIDSERLGLVAFETCAEAFGLADATPLFLQLVGVSDANSRPVVRDWFLQRGRTAAEAEHFFERWMAGFHAVGEGQAVPLKPGVTTLLDYLAAAGVARLVATSTRTDIALAKLEAAGIRTCFDAVIGGERVSAGKPAPDIYRLAASTAAEVPAQCLVLEDSPNGVRAGVAAGAQTIQVPDLITPDAALLALGHTVVATLDEVVEMFEGQCGKKISRPWPQ